MGKLKSAYELATERIIVAKKYYNEEDARNAPIDFVEIPEFSNKEDKVLESYETKLITGEEEVDVKEEEFEKVRVQEPETIYFEGKHMECCWNGHFFDYGGFARMNRTMAFGLSDRNVKVKVEIEPYLTHVNQATQDQLKSMSRCSIAPDAPKIFGVTVPSNISYAGKKIVYTMIETSEKVHPNYSGKLNLVDEIWVATEYGKRILENSNVYPPIYVMPLGVDPERYKPDSGIMNFGSTRDFVFTSVFRWSYRKGFDILLRAYMEEFSGKEDVSLLLISRAVNRPEEIGAEQILADFNGIKDGIDKTEEELPHIALYNKPIHERDMPKVYNSSDAFVLISRGEGFCLPMIEAASTGLPVIASNVTGQTDFLREDNSFLVEPDDYAEAQVAGRLSRMAKLCHFYEGQIFPEFGIEAIEKTKEHMRFVYENRKEAQIKADKLRSLIVNNYTWGMSVDNVYRRLKEIS